MFDFSYISVNNYYLNCKLYFYIKGWPRLIHKVYEIDPLPCPQYVAEMVVIAFITDHKVIYNIIDYLPLRFQIERPTLP